MAGTIWVFAYGSLMWRPGFAYESSEPALLEGYHRALCVSSYVHRGTRQRPGLVLGLDRGGRCRGRAFGIAPVREPEVLTYLDERELVTNVYQRRRLPVTLASGPTVEAWCYLVRRDHEQYVGHLPEAERLRRIRQASGISGPCAEYLHNTVAHLRTMGIREPELERLALLAGRG